MSRRRKFVFFVLFILVIGGISFGLRQAQTGGCSACGLVTPEQGLEGGGDHQFEDQSEDVTDQD